MLNFILLIIAAYLSGSVSFGHLIARYKNVDIMKIGSKSPTSTNVARALGWKWGALSAILDFSKGFVPTLAAVNILSNPWQIILVAILPTVGHIFPIFFNFQGGKGGAAFLGACLGLIGVKLFALAFLVWLLIFALTRMTSVTNLVFPWLFSAFLYFYFPQYLAFGIIEAVIINFALRKNVKRLIQGEENKTPLKI
ncbi:MAG: glycerol-3-phosphate acyltransferase [Candidatus Nealsonbacteria bacterium]|nr:glycerol-3-phosphate acyltransferase [Candidatus Nealsonbacteria bacterium]